MRRKVDFGLIGFAVAAAFSLLFGSCAGADSSRVFIDAVSEQDRLALDEIDGMLLRHLVASRQGESEAVLGALLREASAAVEALSGDSVNKIFLARLAGLRGWVELMEGGEPDFGRLAKDIESLSRREEFLFLFMMMQERSDAAKIRQLEAATEQAFTARIAAFLLAEAVFDSGDYERAAVLMDELVLTLPEFTHSWLIERRKLAVTLHQASEKGDGGGLDRAALIRRGSMTLSQMVQALHQGSDFLLGFSFDRQEPAENLIKSAKDAGYLLPGASASAVATRADVAFLFMNVIAHKEDDPSLLNLYASLYSVDSGMETPVPDLPLEHYGFNAVLLVVERAVMDLPDGVNFEPDRPIRPENFFNRIEQLNQTY